MLLHASKKETNFVKYYTFAAKHKLNVYKVIDLHIAIVFPFGLDLIETQLLSIFDYCFGNKKIRLFWQNIYLFNHQLLVTSL